MSGQRDTDPAPAEWVLTSFDQLSAWRFDVEDQLFHHLDPEPDVDGPRPVVRESRSLTRHHRIGLREWDETVTVTIYRTVRPCTSRWAGRTCTFEHGHDGPHHHPGVHHAGYIELPCTWQ